MSFKKSLKILDSINRKLLSFAWLAWDVINVVRRLNMLNYKDSTLKFSFDPLSERITQHIQEYIKKRKRKDTYLLYKRCLKGLENESKIEIILWKMVKLYCDYNLGQFIIFDVLIFFRIRRVNIFLFEMG